MLHPNVQHMPPPQKQPLHQADVEEEDTDEEEMSQDLGQNLRGKGVSNSTIESLEHGFITKALFDNIAREDLDEMNIRSLAQKRLLTTLYQNQSACGFRAKLFFVTFTGYKP